AAARGDRRAIDPATNPDRVSHAPSLRIASVPPGHIERCLAATLYTPHFSDFITDDKSRLWFALTTSKARRMEGSTALSSARRRRQSHQSRGFASCARRVWFEHFDSEQWARGARYARTRKIRHRIHGLSNARDGRAHGDAALSSTRGHGDQWQTLAHRGAHRP